MFRRHDINSIGSAIIIPTSLGKMSVEHPDYVTSKETEKRAQLQVYQPGLVSRQYLLF